MYTVITTTFHAKITAKPNPTLLLGALLVLLMSY